MNRKHFKIYIYTFKIAVIQAKPMHSQVKA